MTYITVFILIISTLYNNYKQYNVAFFKFIYEYERKL